VFICHWDAIRLMPKLQAFGWGHVIGDEIQRIGNRDAQVTQAFTSIKARFKYGLSGTPYNTRPEQYWSVLHWLYPQQFSSYWRFFNHYIVQRWHTAGGGCSAILDPKTEELCLKFHKRAFREIVGLHDEDGLLSTIQHFYVRRLKKDVYPELPDKYYSTIQVELPPKQRRMYDSMREDMLAWVGQNEDQPLAAPIAIARLVRLQQLAAASAEIIEVVKRRRATDADNRFRAIKGLPPIAFVSEPARVVKLMEPSAKIDAVMEKIAEMDGKSVVVFSASKQVIKLLAARLSKEGYSYGTLTGDTPQADRGQLIRDFQQGLVQVFAGTIQAGGVGITLTRADTAIFVDRVWSPAQNVQAEDRLHRIGQENAVHVIDIVATDTVDLGRLQHIEQNWNFLRRLLGDKVRPEDFRFTTPYGVQVND
jgi:SNF2 family DNA or RNA helicase